MTADKAKILVIDDSLFMALMFKDMISGTEFEVVGTATTSVEGLQKYKELKPDVVLLDIVMPDETGNKVLIKILDFDPEASVIMVSSLGTQEKVVECLKKGAKYFITKPFEQGGLLRALRDFKHIGQEIPPKRTVELSFTGINLGMKFFGQYLLERGLINSEQLLKSVEYQKSVNLSLEQMFINKGLLSENQVKKIHALQQNDLNREFGETVIERGFLTKEVLEGILKEQKENRLYIGECLVKIGAISPEQLAQTLKDYKEEQEKDEWAIGSKLESIKNNLVVKTYINFTMKMFQKIIKETVKLKTCISSRDLPVLWQTGNFVLNDYTIEQKAVGDTRLAFIINLPKDISFKIVSTLFDKQITEIKDLEIDALKEFLNIINGNCCAKLSNLGINIETTPPELYDNKTANKYSLPKKAEVVFVSLISTIGNFDLLIARMM